MTICYDALCGHTPRGHAMSAAATTELPNIAALSSEQKQRLLALLIKDELDQQPIPLAIIVRLDGEELGHFRPKIKHRQSLQRCLPNAAAAGTRAVVDLSTFRGTGLACCSAAG